MAVNLPRAVQFQFIRQVRRVEVDHCSLRPHSVPLCPLASPHENFFAVLPTHSPSYRFPRGKFMTADVAETVVIINERIELLAISSLEEILIRRSTNSTVLRIYVSTSEQEYYLLSLFDRVAI